MATGGQTGGLYIGAPGTIGAAIARDDRLRAEEQAARQGQVGNAAALNFLRGQGMEGTPATKAFEVNGRTVGQNRAAVPMSSDPLRALAMMGNPSSPLQSMAAQQAIQTLFPQGFSGTVGKNERAYQNGKVVAEGPMDAPEAAYKDGELKDIIVGDRVVPHVYTGGQWKPVGPGGPRWEGQRAPQKPYGYDDEQARKAEEAARKARADEYSFQTTDEGFSDIMRSAAKLGTNPKLAEYTGSYDALTPNWSAGAKQFQSDLDVLKSNLAMNALNAARAGSATGATGFGALSEGELKILQNQIATLDPSVGPENFQKQIVDIITKTKKMQGALRSTRPANAAAPSTKSAIPGFKIEPLD